MPGLGLCLGLASRRVPTPVLNGLFTLTFYDDGFKDANLTGSDIGALWVWSGGDDEAGNQFTGGGGDTGFNGTTLTLTASAPENITGIELANEELGGAFFSLAPFTALTTLAVSGNALTGPIGALPATLESFNSASGNAGINGATPAIPASCYEFTCRGAGFTSLGNLAAAVALEIFDVRNCAALTTYAGGDIPLVAGGLFRADGCALTQASVDAILAGLVAGGAEDADINLSGGTNAVPSAAGLTDKTALEGAGCTVTVNS